jgi:hypothetical protein
MVVLLKRTLFCAVLQGIGMVRFALSAFNAEGHAAWDYASESFHQFIFIFLCESVAVIHLIFISFINLQTASSSEMLSGASKNQYMNTPGEPSQMQGGFSYSSFLI